MKNNLLLPILFLIFTINNSAQGEINTTDSINSHTIKNLNELIDENTVVFIEMDDVLVMPKSKMFYYGDNPYRLFINDLVTLSKQNPGYLNQIISWYQARKIMLIEDEWPGFINNLKQRKIPVYGLCAMPIQLQNIEQKRFMELKELGIIFTDKVNGKEEIEIEKNEGWSSVFYHGIIFTGPFSKSRTLLDFIKVTNISPKKLVVFDKAKYELQLIEKEFQGFRISFYGIMYEGAKKFTDKADPKVIRLQQKTLLEQRKWLEDSEAEKLIGK